MTPDELTKFQATLLNEDPLALDVWRSKYRHGDEASPAESRARVVTGVWGGANDLDSHAYRDALDLVTRGVLIPAGRVNAGAGTGRRTTLLNCFVNETVQDSMPGINRAIARAALTLQQGGGIGTDWSTVRPAGALVKRTQSVASGAIPFMRQMNAMAATAASAGDRRGAMMGTLRDDHPDLWNPDQHATGRDVRGQEILTSPSFLSVKTRPGELTFMNLSVLVSDAFRRAIHEGTDWDLGHHVPRADGNHVAIYDRPVEYDALEVDESLLPVGDVVWGRGEVHPWYVYRRLPARQLWDEILRTTYKYAEPGVIFVDRVNQRNNLSYCEDIRCTNPCGEQPLPPNNVCCLASVNLAFLVENPFTPAAKLDVTTYRRAIRAGVRFLDNVLDATNYPLTAQREASVRTRRIGLGITGFGDMLVQYGIRYGSEESVRLARHLSQTLQIESYVASVLLSKERGSFPAFEANEFLRGHSVGKLPGPLQGHIREHGIRNGVLNTIAPNGTISLYVGNVSSGHEPVFSFRPSTRKIRQPDDTTRSYEVIPYSLRLHRQMFPRESGVWAKGFDTDAFVGATDLTPEEHLTVHGAWQEHIDAAVSKTINCPASVTFDEFKAVYDRAWELGAKGCTTYRPDPTSGRGSVMSEDAPDKDAVARRASDFLQENPPNIPPHSLVLDEAAWDVARGAAETATPEAPPPPIDRATLAIGHCPGCGQDVWIESGKKYICSGCKHVLQETTKEEAQARLRCNPPLTTPPPAPELRIGDHEMVLGRLPETNEHIDLPKKIDFDCPNCGVHHSRYPGVFVCSCKYAYEVGPTPLCTTLHDPAPAPDEPVAPRPPDDDSDRPAPLPTRPGILDGRTHKFKWPGDGVNWYVTVTNDGRRVREIFVAGGDAESREWVEALCRTATAVLRRDGDVRFLAEELGRVASAKGGHFVDRVHRPSVVAAIGGVLGQEIERLRKLGPAVIFAEPKDVGLSAGFAATFLPATYVSDSQREGSVGSMMAICPKCGETAMIREAGCMRCLSCAWEKCG